MIKLQPWSKIIANIVKMLYFLQFYNKTTILQSAYIVPNIKIDIT